ncbi:MAG: D-alanyl-D-alanine carboxypeptidase/D-alanyl-D-alanine-endopeptidase [Dermatophilaceae bacterium]
MRRLPAALLVLLLVAAGYLTADVYDLVPGFLTLAPATRSGGIAKAPVVTKGASPSGQAAAVPIPSAVFSPAAPLELLNLRAPVPTRARLTALLAAALADPGLGPSVALTVRDARTGSHLLDVSAQVPRIPASTVKLLTAAAVMSTPDPARTLVTRAVRGLTDNDVILVAGGDTLLSPGAGDPAAVAGRAGLADLAGQTARALKLRHVTRVRLHLDDRFARGPSYGPGWIAADIEAGLTGSVAMLGLSTQRPAPGVPAPADPALSTTQAFRVALASEGVTVAAPIDRVASPEGSPDLGVVQSAPLADVMALALSDSDDALTESLARQGAVQAGRPTSFAAVAAWVRQTLATKGVEMSGVTLVDSCGLAPGTLIPVRVLGDVLALAAGGQDPALQEVVSQLPVAGLSGTLAKRFLKGPAHAAAGTVRAKTGTLTGVSSLAGTVVDKDGRLLTFAILADKVAPGVGTLSARAALDRFVAVLAGCGCG